MPFLTTYCVQCHNPKTAEAELDLTRYTSAAALGEHFRQWEHVVVFLRSEEMPPEKAKQPPPAERAEVLQTLERLLAAEARKLAGDPGVVLPRRLTNAEYNYTIRDLTGVDIRPAASFPVDPASGEGFSNTGEALVMSPSLFKKYYAAAQHVADHVVLTPSGMRFAPYPVVTFADQIKLHEQAILRFYEEHDVDYEEYLTAAWSYRHRPADRQSVTIEQWAAEKKLSPKYLRTLWDTLERRRPMIRSISAGSGGSGTRCRRRRIGRPCPADSRRSRWPRTFARSSKLLCAKETAAIVSNAGNGPVQHIDRRKKTAAERDTLDRELHRRQPALSRRVPQAARSSGNQDPLASLQLADGASRASSCSRI